MAEWISPHARVPALRNWWVDVPNPMALPYKPKEEPEATNESPPPVPPPKPKVSPPVVPDAFWYTSGSKSRLREV
jgi:hypothetical protein